MIRAEKRLSADCGRFVITGITSSTPTLAAPPPEPTLKRRWVLMKPCAVYAYLTVRLRREGLVTNKDIIIQNILWV